MNHKEIESENSRRRKIQFRRLADFSGFTEEAFEKAAKSRFIKPWDELSASQKRGRLLNEQFLRCYNKSPCGDDRYTFVAYRSLFFPSEIIYAMDMIPFTTEMTSAQLAQAGLAQKLLETAEGNGFSPDVCSFIKTAAGAVLEDIFPVPDVILTSTHLCDPSASFGSFLAEKYNRPEFVLDVPYGVWGAAGEGTTTSALSNAIEYVASQLQELVEFVEGITGLQFREEKLKEAISFSNEAMAWLKRGNELIYFSDKFLVRGGKELNFAANLMQTWGTKEIVDVYKTRFHELQIAEGRAPKREKPRIVWAHLKPYYSNELLNYIEQKADIVGAQINFVFWEEMNPDDPFRAIAKRIVLHPAYCPLKQRTHLYTQILKPGDGVIAYYPKSCRHFHSSSFFEGDTFKERGIPYLALDGDCIDNRGDDFLVLKTRVDRFLKKLGV